MGLGAGDIIKATGVARVAFADPLRRQGATAQGSMHLYGLLRVMRAARIEAALVACPGAQHFLVKPDDAEQERFHGGRPVWW